MSKIKEYANRPDPILSSDKLVGTSGTDDSTKNWTLAQLAAYVSDYIDDGGVLPDNSQRILVTTYYPGAVIGGEGVSDDNISKAVNRSFRGIISVSRYEVVLFRALRQELVTIDGDEAFVLLEEQYYYTAGEGTINSDTTIDDFVLDYSREFSVTVLEPPLSNPAQTKPLPSPSTGDPAGTVNAQTTVVTLDASTKNQYLALFDETTEDDIEVYRYTGPTGNFGSGPDIADPADFVAVSKNTASAKFKLSDFQNDGDGVNAFATTTDLPTNTSDLVNDGDGVNNFATVNNIPSNVSDLANDAGYITISSVPTNVSDLANDAGYVTSVPTNTSDLVNDGDGTASKKYPLIDDVSVAGSFPLLTHVSVTLSASEVRNGSSSPVLKVAAPGAGFTWKFVSGIAKNTFNSVAFDVDGDIYLRYSGGDVSLGEYIARVAQNAFVTASATTNLPISEKLDALGAYAGNDDIYVEFENDSSVGDGTITLELILARLPI